MTDHLRLQTVQAEKLERLPVLAGGQLDLRAPLAQELHERAEDQDVRGCGDVDPDLQARQR